MANGTIINDMATVSRSGLTVAPTKGSGKTMSCMALANFINHTVKNLYIKVFSSREREMEKAKSIGWMAAYSRVHFNKIKNMAQVSYSTKIKANKSFLNMTK